MEIGDVRPFASLRVGVFAFPVQHHHAADFGGRFLGWLLGWRDHLGGFGFPELVQLINCGRCAVGFFISRWRFGWGCFWLVVGWLGILCAGRQLGFGIWLFDRLRLFGLGFWLRFFRSGFALA